MSRVKLGDVAFERKESCKDDKEQYLIVGLEHLVSDQINLTAWSDDAETTFTKFFHKGDVLFGRRRAYLRKAVIAPFDGICSGDITVISAIDGKILPELLPHIIQNEAFFDFAVGKSDGSLSPRVKWEKLEKYEFNLPTLDEQKKLAEVLWSMVETKEAYRDLLQKTDELVKSQFIEMFKGKGYTEKMGKELFKFSSGKFLSEEKRLETGIPVYGGNGIAWYTDESFIDFDTIVIGRVGAYCGNVRLVKGYKWITDNAIYIAKFKTDDFVLEFLTALMTILDFHQYAGTAAQPKITQKPLEEQLYVVPPKEEQVRFAEFVKQSDKSKFALQQALDALNRTYKKIIAENLG